MSAEPRIERRGARVLLIDDAGRILMVRGHDPHQPERTFWFTPGGGIEDGEDSRAAAVRELAEETGYVLEPHEIVGPVWRRTAVFDFASRPYVQHEEFFVGRVADAERRGRGEAELTQTEIEAIDEVAWLTHEELANDEREVFPDVLRESWAEFLEWDGVTRDLGSVSE
ncbi:MAG: NUDIX domain-containing protein [Actinomycetes bacterium]